MIDFYQIHYRSDQQAQIFPWAIPYHNETLTQFFENSVIAELVEKSNAEKIAVVSWALKHKMRTFNVPPRVELKEEHLHESFDVLAFTRNSRAHQMLEAMDHWHPGSKELLKQICEEIGVPFVNEVRYPIYQNAFCATSQVYKAYVKEALLPAMWAMELKFKEQCWKDSNYYKLKNPEDDFSARVKQFLGTDYCPLHPFLLERLFSVWIDRRDLNVRYL